MSDYLHGCDVIGALASNVERPIARPTATATRPVFQPSRVTLTRPSPAAAGTFGSAIKSVALAPVNALKSVASAAIAPITKAVPPPAPKAAVAQASPAAVARSVASANKLVAKGRQLASKRGGSKLGGKLAAAGQRSLAIAAKAQSVAAHRMMGDDPFVAQVLGEAIGVDWGSIGKTALDPSAWLSTQAGTDDALAAMADTASRALAVIDALNQNGHTDVANQGQAIVDNMSAIIPASATQAPDGSWDFSQVPDTSLGPQAFKLIQQENNWENTAAPLAGLVPGTGAPASGTTTSTGAAPTISSVIDSATGGAQGAPGDTVSITGSGFTGATSVDFNGTSTQFQVVSDTQIQATVPQALSGPVHVTTSKGTGSYSSFTTIPSSSTYGGGGGSYGGGGGDFGGGGGGDDGMPDDGGGGDFIDTSAPSDAGTDWGDDSSGLSDEVPDFGALDDSTDESASVSPDQDPFAAMLPSDESSDVSDGADTSTDTEEASVDSQYLVGLDVILGTDTIPRAGAVYTDKATVLAVQAALKDKGFNPGTLDGVMGPHTAKAIRAAQSAAGIPTTGVIDEGVIAMLGVTPGVLPPGVTAQQKAAVEAQVALDAATAVEHAVTPSDVQAAAAQVVNAAPAQPPELKQEAEAAHTAVLVATTPAQLAAAHEQVQAVAQKVVAAVAPGFWGSPLWSGAPIKRWQGAVGGVGALALLTGVIAAVRR